MKNTKSIAFLLLLLLAATSLRAQSDFFTFGKAVVTDDATLAPTEAEYVFVSSQKFLRIKSNNQYDSIPAYPMAAGDRYEYHLRLSLHHGVDNYPDRKFTFTIQGAGTAISGEHKARGLAGGKCYTVDVDVVEDPINSTPRQDGGYAVQEKDAAIVILESDEGLELEVTTSVKGVRPERKVVNGKNEYTLRIPIDKKGEDPVVSVKTRDGRSNVIDVDVSGVEARQQLVYDITRIAVDAWNHMDEVNYVVFDVEPRDANAVVIIDGMRKPCQNGTYQIKLPTGVCYPYTVRAQGYYSHSGKVVASLDGKVTERVVLQPNFGALVLRCPAAMNGAVVLLDGDSVGVLPLTLERVSSGEHRLAVMKDKYKGYRTTVVIEDGKTRTQTVELSQNFAGLSFIVPEGCEVYVNDERQQVIGGRVTGDFEGTLEVVCKRPYHNATRRTVRVTPGKEQTLTLDAPTPVTCRLEIESEPQGAQIWIDGQRMDDVAPMVLPRQLIGPHTIVARMEGYCDEEQSVVLKEGEGKTLSFAMRNAVTVSFTANASAYEVLVDGQNLGCVHEGKLSVGKHKVTFRAAGYHDYETTINVPERTSINARMTPDRLAVTIMVKPGSADLYVDNVRKPVGQQFELDYGKHDVHIEADRYHAFNTSIDLQGNYKTFSYELKKKRAYDYDNLSVWALDLKGAMRLADERQYLLGPSLAITPRKMYGWGVYGTLFFAPYEDTTASSSSTNTRTSSSSSTLTFGDIKWPTYGFVAGITKRIGAADSEWDFQLYAGAGSGSNGLLVDAGVKVGFDPKESNVGLNILNLSAGVMYEPQTNNYFVTAGLSCGFAVLAASFAAALTQL